MKVANSWEMSVSFYQNKRCHVLGDKSHGHHHEKLMLSCTCNEQEMSPSYNGFNIIT